MAKQRRIKSQKYVTFAKRRKHRFGELDLSTQRSVMPVGFHLENWIRWKKRRKNHNEKLLLIISLIEIFVIYVNKYFVQKWIEFI